MAIKTEKLTHAFLSKHPDTAARVLERLEPSEVVALFDALPIRIILPVMRSMSSMTAAHCLRLMETDRQMGLASELGVREAANIIRLWSAPERSQLLHLLPTRLSLNIRRLLRYPAESVGSIMNTEYISVYSNQYVGDVEEILRKSKIDHQDEVYVTDDNQRLRGIVSIMRLLREDNALKVTQVMRRGVPAILATAHVSQILDHTSWEARHTLPVIDRDKRLVGTLQRSTLLDKLESRTDASESYGNLALDVVHAYWSGWVSMLTAILANSSRVGKRSP